MTADEIIDALEASGCRFELVGAYVREEGTGKCPLCVAYRHAKKGVGLQPLNVEAATCGMRLGLTSSEAADFVFAADGLFVFSPGRKRLRARLLGLVERGKSHEPV